MNFAYIIELKYKDIKETQEQIAIFDTADEFNSFVETLQELVDGSSTLESFKVSRLGSNEFLNMQPLELVDKCISMKYLLRFIREGMKLI